MPSPLAPPTPPSGTVKYVKATISDNAFEGLLGVNLAGDTSVEVFVPWTGFLLPAFGSTVWVATIGDVPMFAVPVGGRMAQTGTQSVTITAGNSSGTAAVSFSPNFHTTPLIYLTWDNTSGTGDYAFLTVSKHNISGSGFTIILAFSTAGTLGSNMTAAVDWLAIGT